MRIGLLGVVEAHPVAGNGVAPLRGVRLRGLLARLALDAGRPVGTSILVDDLWGEQPPDGVGNALQALVSRLRRAVGPELIGTEAGGYRLVVPRDAVDALRFDALVADAGRAEDAGAAHALLRAALGLWRGPALADVEDLPFAAAAAARLAERRASAVEQSARLALQLGTADAERAELAAQLDAAPLRETTAAVLARVLHAAGRQAEALAVVDRTVARLADELGVDPGPELAEARMAVLRGPAPRVAAPAAGAPISSFVGRDRDLERVRALLGSHRLVTLIGPGGAGKTRLAREALADAPARVRVAELAPLTAAEQLPAAVLVAVGGPDVQLRGPDEPDTTARLVSALAGPDTLLVLDNCEHLVDGVAALAETLLRASPRLRVLATSREPLGVPGEMLHPVEALTEAEAVRLFVDRAAAVSPGFVGDAPVVAEICRRLDGQPLPIELAAARTRTLSPAEIAERLADRFRLLTSGARTALPRHQTLRAVVDWSWDLLAEPERAVARRLGAFAGGASLAAAERVCAASGDGKADGGGPATDDVFGLLAALVDKSLVVAVAQPDRAPTRYRMLETIRVYAVERLDEAGERAAAEAAHLAAVLELVEAAEPRLRTADQLEWLARLRAESEEIDIALRRTVAAGDAAAAHRIVAAMGWSWLMRGLVDEAARWFEAVHPLDGPVPPPTRALVSAYLGILRFARNDRTSGADHVAAAVAAAELLPRPWHPLLELIGPAYALYTRNDDGPMRRLSQAPAPWVRAFALQALAVAAENSGRIEEQRRLLRAARDVHATTGDRFGLGLAVHGLGELEDVAGEPAAAAAAYDESIALATELRNDDVAQFLARRARLFARQADVSSARATLARAVAAAEDTPTARLMVQMTRAEVELLAGDLDTARAAVAAVESGMADLDVHDIALPQRRAYSAVLRADVELASGDHGAARAPLAAAVTAAIDGRDGPVSGVVAEVAARFVLAGWPRPSAARSTSAIPGWSPPWTPSAVHSAPPRPRRRCGGAGSCRATTGSASWRAP